ncbi:MAG: IS1634 family transposase, partial [Alphaproteobacteria bacterium]
MYFRIVRAKGAKGRSHEYIRLVESYRDKGKNKQRTVANLGRKDLLLPHLDSLNRLLRGDGRPSDAVRIGDVKAVHAWDWGPVLVARHLWRELGLEQILDQLAPRRGRQTAPLADRVFALVANRLCRPGSEHRLARWLEHTFVCDRRGQPWQPQWRHEAERRASRAPRVRVQFRQLQHWYRTLDQLGPLKQEIERELFHRLRDLFSLKVDLVFYDLTSTYFEGHGPPRLGAHGYSRDGKGRRRQVLLGCVMVDGWPIAHHVFAGNWRDSTTVPSVLADLEQRFGLGRIVFVGDRGMVTSDNLALLRQRAQGYIVGLQRRRREDVYRYIEQARGAWIRCPVGVTAREQREPPQTVVQEVASDTPGVRIFVVHSDDRLEYERGQRLKAMARVRERLEALQERVSTGRLKAADKVGAAAARALTDNHGYRYYDWAYANGQFRFFEHPVTLKREEAYEGKYVIQTEEQNVSAVDAVTIYKQLSDVERAFANLKDVIEMRPIFHHSDERVQAHIFIAALAFV